MIISYCPIHKTSLIHKKYSDDSAIKSCIDCVYTNGFRAYYKKDSLIIVHLDVINENSSYPNLRGKSISWVFSRSEIIIQEFDCGRIKSQSTLPFFLPDFSDLPKLISKINNYFIFL